MYSSKKNRTIVSFFGFIALLGLIKTYKGFIIYLGKIIYIIITIPIDISGYLSKKCWEFDSLLDC